THLITTSFLVVILFFGGWHFPWIAAADSGPVAKLNVLAVKMGLFIVIAMLIRWTIPRFRFDQLMGLAWNVFIPLTLLNLIAVLIVKQSGMGKWAQIRVLVVLWMLLLLGVALLNLQRPRTRSDIGEVRRRQAETVAS